MGLDLKLVEKLVSVAHEDLLAISWTKTVVDIDISFGISAAHVVFIQEIWLLALGASIFDKASYQIFSSSTAFAGCTSYKS